MPADTESVATLTTSILQRAGQMATLPEVAMQAMRIADRPGATGAELSTVLANDPTLSARVLRIVNSAFYGVRREVTSVATAVSVLGFSAIRSVVIATSLTRLFRGVPSGSAFAAPELWRHSIAVATASRMIAIKVPGVDPDIAFLSGLMHDIGIIVELQAMPDAFHHVILAVDADPTRTFREAERSQIGTDHEVIGAALCRSWRFPELLVRAVEFHHRPLDIPSGECPTTAVVHLADRIAAGAGIGYARTVEATRFDSHLADVLGVAPAAVHPDVAQLTATVDEVVQLLSGAA